MTSVGTQLRSAREDQQRSLAEIAEDLCITHRYLRAIEEDDLAGLPGVFFYKSFVKQYASILQVDMKQLQPGIEALCPSVVEPSESALPLAARPLLSHGTAQPIRQPEPVLQDFNRYVSDRRIGVAASGLVVVLLVCSGFYAWWTKAPAPAVTVQTQSAPAQPQTAVTSVTIPVTQSGTITRAELNVSATETTWLSITANGKEIFSGVLQPSQSKTLTGVEGAQIRVGNAGGIEVRWKGKPIGPFGPSGQVRTVQLTEDNFKIIPPEQPPTPDPAL